MSQPEINLNDAREFLETLDPDGRFTFQAIRDSTDGKRGGPIFHGTLAEHHEALTRYNRLGYGIFVMVNEGDCLGRTSGNVVRVRAIFIDLDGAPIGPALAAADPHLVVESSPGRWHVYWKVENCPLSEFKQRQQQLSRRFNSDASVCDLPRLMRLPGFLHQKSAPFLSRLVPRTEWNSLKEMKL